MTRKPDDLRLDGISRGGIPEAAGAELRPRFYRVVQADPEMQNCRQQRDARALGRIDYGDVDPSEGYDETPFSDCTARKKGYKFHVGRPNSKSTAAPPVLFGRASVK